MLVYTYSQIFQLLTIYDSPANNHFENKYTKIKGSFEYSKVVLYPTFV